MILDEDKLKKITTVLQEKVKPGECISRDKLYELCGGEEYFQMELYVVRSLISAAIRSGQIEDFVIRTGRGKGVCCPEVFSDRTVNFSQDEIEWVLRSLKGSGKHPIVKRIIDKLKGRKSVA